MNEILSSFISDYAFYLDLLISHIKITLVAVSIASIIGIFIGVFISEKPKYANVIISLINILYTIPSIALLGVLISITGIGNTTAIIALTLYALLPIVRSTYIGIVNIDEKIIEASEAMGSTNNQIMFKIKLPLAFPIIFSAIRNMVTMTIALAGIASFVGAGGLGVAIYRGITTNNKVLILLGSFLIAFMAIIFDYILGYIENIVVKRKKVSQARRTIIGVLTVIIFVSTILFNMNSKSKVIKLASKPTTEGYILAEIVRELIENKTDLQVDLTQGVGGGTSNLHPALLKGEFDMYPEYTGTAWQIVLKETAPYSNDLFGELKQKYDSNYSVSWMGMFGFNNTYGLGVRKELAEKYNLKTYSDLSKYSDELIFGAEYDFFEREDGFNSLSKAYNLKFAKNVDMDNGLKYQALLDGKIDVMTVFTTDGQLSDSRIVVLEDDLKFYPSYMAGMVVRNDIIEKYPELNPVLDLLNDLISESEMAVLNGEVEINKKKPEDVARNYLISKNLLEE